MRVISQDGTTDVPYENVTLEESYAGKFGDGFLSERNGFPVSKG